MKKIIFKFFGVIRTAGLVTFVVALTSLPVSAQQAPSITITKPQPAPPSPSSIQRIDQVRQAAGVITPLLASPQMRAPVLEHKNSNSEVSTSMITNDVLPVAIQTATSEKKAVSSSEDKNPAGGAIGNGATGGNGGAGGNGPGAR